MTLNYAFDIAQIVLLFCMTTVAGCVKALFVCGIYFFLKSQFARDKRK